ncbi:MAG: PAS domain S-box protein [Nitrospirae bacterium]|nr:PAS domain S-box protein [Nitrospirota bacterium]
MPAIKVGSDKTNDLSMELSIHADINNVVLNGVSYVTLGTVDDKEKFYHMYNQVSDKISKLKSDIISRKGSGVNPETSGKIVLLDRLFADIALMKNKADMMFNHYERTGKLDYWDYAEYEKIHNTLDEGHNKLLQFEETSISAFYRESKDIFDKYLYAIGGFVVFSIIYTAATWIYTTRTISQPMLELKRGADIIMGGNMDHLIKVYTGDEIEELSVIVDNLRKKVKKSLNDKEMEITARDKANARLTTLLNSIPDLIYIKDIYRRYVLVNDAFKDFLGLVDDDIIGNTEERFFPSAVSEKIRESEEDLLENYSIIQDEQKITGSGGDIYLDTIKTPIFSETGEILGFVAVSRDITERKLSERKLQEINEELHMEIQRRHQVESDILSSLKEKEILLKEVHHRVKNNLQIISSLLYLQSINLKDASPQEILSISRNRIRSMALVHEKLYKSENFATIDFGQYIQELALDIIYSFGVSEDKITLDIKCDNILLDVETSIPCGLIVNELVSNAVKYAFPGDAKGEVHISLCEGADGMLSLVIGDNGVGIPKDKDIFNSDSLGLKLVNNLVKQIKGTLEVAGNGGTEFKITFQKRQGAPAAEDSGDG